MYMRAVTIRIVYVGFVSAAILLSIAFRQATVEAAPASVPQASVARTAATLPVTTLSTIHVTASRSTAAHAPAVPRPAVSGPIAATSESAADAHAGSPLPSLRLDMPYYSFGKMVPRVGKE